MQSSLRDTIDRQILPLATRFAQDVARVVAAAMWETIASGVNQEMQSLRQTEPPKQLEAAGAKSSAKGRAAPTKAVAKEDAARIARINAAKRRASMKPVACPVPGCKRPGVRNAMNFCAVHKKSLPMPEKKRLRALQIKAAAAA